MTTVPIPGEDAPLTVLEFEQGASEHGDPPFIIDHGNMLSSLTAWVKQPPGLVCVINGLVKTGKTAALTKVLPQLVLQRDPGALFCHLNFVLICGTPADSTKKEVAKVLRANLRNFALQEGLPVREWLGSSYADVTTDIRIQMEGFAVSGRRIYFLIDEVRVRGHAVRCALPHAGDTTVPFTVAPRRSSRGACPPLCRFSGSFRLPVRPTGLCSSRC